MSTALAEKLRHGDAAYELALEAADAREAEDALVHGWTMERAELMASAHRDGTAAKVRFEKLAPELEAAYSLLLDEMSRFSALLDSVHALRAETDQAWQQIRAAGITDVPPIPARLDVRASNDHAIKRVVDTFRTRILGSV